MLKAKINMSDLVYVMMPGGSYPVAAKDLYQKMLNFWLLEWKKVFQEIDPSYEINISDFENQSRVTAILYHDQVIAMQTLSDYNLNDVLVSPYFKPYTIGFVQELVAQNIKNFQTMQYFIVSEEWGVRRTGINLAAIILGLSFRQQSYFNFDATITLARKDVAAASTARKYNMLQYDCDIKMHNVPVGQLLCKEPVPYPNETVETFVDDLWKRKINFCKTKPIQPAREEIYEQSRNGI